MMDLEGVLGVGFKQTRILGIGNSGEEWFASVLDGGEV